MKIHNLDVLGVGLDGETRCAHYRGQRDIIAIKFKCCGGWFPCHECHAEVALHAPERWPTDEFDTRAVLCGACGHQLTVREYLACGSACPRCGRGFNPGCAKHAHLYFNLPAIP
jgi:uncharacterized CHY-type Zn-finger protein